MPRFTTPRQTAKQFQTPRLTTHHTEVCGTALCACFQARLHASVLGFSSASVSSAPISAVKISNSFWRLHSGWHFCALCPEIASRRTHIEIVNERGGKPPRLRSCKGLAGPFLWAFFLLSFAPELLRCRLFLFLNLYLLSVDRIFCFDLCPGDLLENRIVSLFFILGSTSH
jgi:hypothetical protein